MSESADRAHERASAPGRRAKERGARGRRKGRAAPPPRASWSDNLFLVLLSGAFSLAFVITLAAAGAMTWGRMQITSPGPLAQEKVLIVPKGSGVADIGDLLEHEGMIEQPLLFQGAVYWSRSQSKLRFGEYVIPKQASVAEIVQILVRGKPIMHRVTVPEGLTSWQVVQILKENDVLIGDIADIPPEGSLLPETYTFSRGTTRRDIVKWMTREHKEALEKAWKSRSPDIPVNSPRELVTLASIVEKETAEPEERPEVASVYVNRLRKDMRLQADPTIIYGLFGGQGAPPDRPIFRSDIEKPTAYNTYTINGLPPGPIANPGLASLMAAASPADTEYLYFVADGSGGHVFAKTLKEHNANVREWRAIEKERNKPSEDLPELPDAVSKAKSESD